MNDALLDASALLALAFAEPGCERVHAALPRSAISAVNLSEACAKLIDRGFAPSEASEWLTALGLRIIPFGANHAFAAARLRTERTRKILSFADRACIATAAIEQSLVMTTDRVWATLELPCTVELIRE